MSKRRQADEIKVCGQSAVDALVRNRVDDLIRVYLVEERIAEWAELLRWCAAHRKAYRVVSREELDRVADSTHHEGILVLARARPAPALGALAKALAASDAPAVLLGLEGIANPNNLGAILRAAAHFGARAVLLPASEPDLTPTAHRTAEGGAEAVDVVRVPSLEGAARTLAASGVVSAATVVEGGTTLGETALPKKLLILLGSEARGLTRRARDSATLRLTIPGTGAVESLNVSNAAAVLLYEHARAHPR